MFARVSTRPDCLVLNMKVRRNEGGEGNPPPYYYMLVCVKMSKNDLASEEQNLFWLFRALSSSRPKPQGTI